MRKLFIHLLGGWTKEEYMNSFEAGRRDAFREVKATADNIYGCDADGWCEYIYQYIKGKTGHERED